MSNATYYLTPNAAGTGFQGSGYTPDGTIPEGAIPCTQAQAQNFQQYAPDMSITPPSVVSAPAAQLLDDAQTAQISTLKQSWQKALRIAPVTIGGTTYQIDNSPAQQTSNLNLAISSQQVLATVKPWAADTAVTVGNYAEVNGVILFCSTAGTTGSAAPTPPTTFGTVVTDGTAAWELFGRHVWLANGTPMLMTPQQIAEAAQQIELYMHQQMSTLGSLMQQVSAATNVSAVQAVIWP